MIIKDKNGLYKPFFDLYFVFLIFYYNNDEFTHKNYFMTTITIDNPKLENKYSAYEIKMKFISFLEKDMKNEGIDLYEVSESNLSQNTQKRLKNIDTLNFIEY